MCFLILLPVAWENICRYHLFTCQKTERSQNGTRAYVESIWLTDPDAFNICSYYVLRSFGFSVLGILSLTWCVTAPSWLARSSVQELQLMLWRRYFSLEWSMRATSLRIPKVTETETGDLTVRMMLISVLVCGCTTRYLKSGFDANRDFLTRLQSNCFFSIRRDGIYQWRPTLYACSGENRS